MTSGLSIKVERVTPDIAARWLETYAGPNRVLNQGQIRKITGDILRGDWQLNGETIIFSDNALMDGQHRLWAIVESGCTVDMLVVRGVSDKARDTIDTGRSRSPGDVMSFHGYAHATVAAAAARYVHGIRTRQFDATSIAALDATRPEMLETARSLPHLPESVLWGKRVYTVFAGSAGQYAALHALFFTRHPAKADEFFTRLFEGADLSVGNPVYALRQWLESRRHRDRPNHVRRFIVHLAFVKAWNAFVKGSEMRTIRIMQAEQLPAIQ